MLETIREYAHERLVEADEAESAAKSHAIAYLALCEEAAPFLLGSELTRWLDRLERDHDNIRAAFTWAVESREAQVADRLLWAIWRFWQVRGYLHEGRRWADAVLALPATDPRLRCRAYEAAGGIAYWRTEFDDCASWYSAALELAREIGDPPLLADALYNSAFAQSVPPDFDPVGAAAAEALLTEALDIYKGLGDEIGVTNVLWGSAAVVWLGSDRDLSRAIEFFGESAAVYRKAGDFFQYGWAERMLGRTLLELGRTEESVDHIRTAIDIFLPARDVSALTLLILDLSLLALRHGDESRALRLQGAARAMRKKTGVEMGDFRFDSSDEIDALLESRGDTAQPLLDEGAAMSLDEALAYAFGDLGS